MSVRVPMEVAREAGLTDGEMVEVEALGGDLFVRRGSAHVLAREDAGAAAAEIIAESESYTLGSLSILDLLQDGRRG